MKSFLVKITDYLAYTPNYNELIDYRVCDVAITNNDIYSMQQKDSYLLLHFMHPDLFTELKNSDPKTFLRNLKEVVPNIEKFNNFAIAFIMTKALCRLK